MLRNHAKGKNNPGPANIASWILESRSIPDGMAFVKDPKNNNHYFLAVTHKIHVSKLVSNLKMISHAMTIMRDLKF